MDKDQEIKIKGKLIAKAIRQRIADAKMDKNHPLYEKLNKKDPEK